MININIYSGPGVGKSTIASALFSKMKINNYKVELVHEYAKELTYKKNYISLNDQLYLYGTQHHRAFILTDTVDYAIHDSPALMGSVYLDRELPYAEEFLKLMLAVNKSYNNINIFLERNLKAHSYQEYGRSQSLEEAILKDKEIMKMLDDNNIPYIKIKMGKKSIKKIYKLVKGNK